MPPRKLLVFLTTFLVVLFTFLDPSFAAATNVSIDFPYFTLRNLTLLGDSYLRNGVVGLTRELGVPSSSAGTMIYNKPITFFDLESNVTASFSTRFSFSIANVNPSSFGDGLAFFLSPDNQTLGSPGGYLGLVNSSQLTKNKFLAIEFDTRLDPHFDDPNENHVGLDIESLISIKTGDAMLQGIDLKSGNWITAWIDYVNGKRKLHVSLSYSSFKPEKPVLSVDIDLSDYLKPVMYVGFSASTEGSTELHLIENWSFSTFGFVPVRPRLSPHNVSDSSVTVKPAIPVPSSGSKHHKRIGFGLGIAGPAFFFVVLLVFGYVSVRKWRGIRTQMSFKAELLAGPREFSYKELKSATKGFHSSRIIGHGAFGTVYKAIFASSRTGTIAAVKRSKHSHEERPTMRRVLQILNNEVEPLLVPRIKPSLSFSYGLPCLEDIVSESEEEEEDSESPISLSEFFSKYQIEAVGVHWPEFKTIPLNFVVSSVSEMQEAVLNVSIVKWYSAPATLDPCSLAPLCDLMATSYAMTALISSAFDYR
ncbi:hypothetical protein FH972_020187 [Carpinus fangiana]|uniref:Legume lectin domain-containing protein n=1 Tax=Carpinus fangiana TaxID=176857 RepID=A0A5N6RVN5_9ROSI|nr:hypothetical protein FH972_020187 [Carpinus fangiana]